MLRPQLNEYLLPCWGDNRETQPPSSWKRAAIQSPFSPSRHSNSPPPPPPQPPISSLHFPMSQVIYVRRGVGQACESKICQVSVPHSGLRADVFFIYLFIHLLFLTTNPRSAPALLFTGCSLGCGNQSLCYSHRPTMPPAFGQKTEGPLKTARRHYLLF